MTQPQAFEAKVVSFVSGGSYRQHTVHIIHSLPKGQFYWEWHYNLSRVFTVRKSARSLDEMRTQLIKHYDVKRKMRSQYKKDYECFVSKHWIPFCSQLIKSINSKNHFFVSFLEELASYEEDSIRLLVAQCDYTPLNVIEKLREDSVMGVRKVALFYSEHSKIVEHHRPETMNFIDFDDWVHNASIEELEQFSNKVFEEEKKSLFERLLG